MIEQGRSGKRAETAGAVSHIRNRYFIILDVIFLCTIPAIALMLRVDAFPSIASFAPAVALCTAIALVIRLTVFYRFELYWRYASVEELVQIVAAVAVSTANIEARPVWKPMHLQPVFAGCESIGGTMAEKLFDRGLCLPSGSSLTCEDLERVVQVIRSTTRT